MPKGYSKRNQSGWKHSNSSIQKMSINRTGITTNEKNPRWMGEKVSYGALHTWIRNHFGTPNVCEECGKNEKNTFKIHWANISKKYKRNRNDWKRLCAKCHKIFDKNKKQTKYERHNNLL